MAGRTRASSGKPFDILHVNQMCMSLLKPHCHIFRCVFFTQRNTIRMCSQAAQTTAPRYQALLRPQQNSFFFLSLVQSLKALLFRLAAVSRVG